MTTLGFFSIVQYCPDLDRGESANVGVVLCVPELGYLDMRMSDNNEGPKQRFSATAVNELRLNAATAAIEGRIRAEGPAWTVPADLVHFAAREGNNLLLTKPRTILCVAPADELSELYQRMVFVERRTKSRLEKPDLKRLLEERAPEVPWLKDYKVELPQLGTLKVPYAYRNGVLNLIRSEAFPSDQATAVQRASSLAVKGHILHNVRSARGERQKLVVIGSFEPATATEVKDSIRFLFAEHDSRFVAPDEIDQFVEQVRAEAHN